MFKWFCGLLKTTFSTGEADYKRGYTFAKKHLADGGTTDYLESCIDDAKMAVCGHSLILEYKLCLMSNQQRCAMIDDATLRKMEAENIAWEIPKTNGSSELHAVIWLCVRTAAFS